jgi:WD40 repeat protein
MPDTSKRKNKDKAKSQPPRQQALIIGLLALCALPLIAVVLRVGPYPGISQLTGQIFYTREGSDFKESVGLNLQTGERTTYPPTPEPPFDPSLYNAWQNSPDGKWHLNTIDKGVYNGEEAHFEVTNTETHETRVVGPFYSGPSYIWSPDSQSLFFVGMEEPFTMNTFDESKTEIWRLDVANAQIIRLTNNTYSDSRLQISPDGTKMAHIGTPDGQGVLFVTDLAAGQSTTPVPEMSVKSFSWSPDGQWIVFEADQGGLSDIYLMRIDGSELQGIATEPYLWERSPIWKP